MNFGNGVAKIVRKNKRDEREIMWRERREKSNFGNGIAKIHHSPQTVK